MHCSHVSKYHFQRETLKKFLIYFFWVFMLEVFYFLFHPKYFHGNEKEVSLSKRQKKLSQR